ncbi:dehydrogenase/reductase SDR family protein member 10 [Dacryopinax primogenitus]|uniref:Dehydrogenase/reductase SDR family protein member 10 n=1 Tax=Dacryopinax primogenitus (strain DJM 731) TaxID=1858805 RepID=M5GE29_DACPD|nr:dehydrogenase/reductase SDR family protein member 10 [Dacryopinax primogenitus]EJU05032.1 dehydrogenase/reductase SDR family protein member 10 [Dacryopinax primogenitus]
MHLQLDNSVVLVTGGTKGIGRAIVQHFLAEGANVAFCARTGSDVEACLQEWKAAWPKQRVAGRALDIDDLDAVKQWVRDMGEEFGGIDCVVSNVSAMAIPNTVDNWKRMFHTDLLSVVVLLEAAIPYLEKSTRSPSIVTISSVSGVELDGTVPGPYGATKAALIHYTQQLAQVLAPKGIRANIVSPGNIYFQDGVWHQCEVQRPEAFARAMANNPLGRMGKPEEVAVQVVMCASPLSGFTSGANILVDGIEHKGVHF